MELSEATKGLILQYSISSQQDFPDLKQQTIHVDEVASRVAAFYEQIRTIIDWKEEHLMRRAAIIRKIKRRFFDLEINNFSTQNDFAESLILELIRGGHFPNDKIKEIKITEVQKIIDKYIFILKNYPQKQEAGNGLDFYNWMLEVLSCEIEESLNPSVRERALIDYMFKSMKEKIKVSENIYSFSLLKKEKTNTQIYIAVQQSLFKLDKPIISYNLITHQYPEWKNADEKLLLQFSKIIFETWQDIEKNLANPIAKKFYAICEKYDTPYLLLGDILAEKNIQAGTEILNPEKLESLIRTAYSRRLSTLKERIKRAAIYSTVSIFVTKILSLFLLEVLLAKIMPGENQSTIMFMVDILVPTLLMFLIVFSIKMPSEKNLNIAIMEIIKIVYNRETPDIYEVKIRPKKGVITRSIISLVYAISSVLSFGAIYYAFSYFGFPISSIFINIIFIALILFAGTAIAKRAEELTIEDEKEGFISFLADVFLLPVQGLGKWLSSKWKKYNAIAAFFNALIDMPFSVFVEFLEKWRYFIKDKKEEIR
jgi:hypothetical protein